MPTTPAGTHVYLLDHLPCNICLTQVVHDVVRERDIWSHFDFRASYSRAMGIMLRDKI